MDGTYATRSGPRSGRRIVCACALAILLGSSPALAGKRDKRFAPSPDRTTATQDDQGVYIPLTLPVAPESVTATASDVGGIDPTMVPIIDEDLKFMVHGPGAQIRADDAHAFATGAGLVVAVLDGGFNLNHPALAGSLGIGYDALDDDFDAHDPGNGIDDDLDGIVDRGGGHGTFVAGMVLLSAPDVTIVPIRIRDDEGWGTNAQTLRGLEFAQRIGADVINLSITNSDWKQREVMHLLGQLVEAGAPVIVSAGNSATSIYEKEMALSEFTLAVGAVDSRDVLADFSNYAWITPMVYAPGVDLWGPIGNPRDDTWGTWSGTSFAAGIVSGAAALARSVHPEYSALQIHDHLRRSVDLAFNAWGWPLGSGRINLLKVVTQ